MGVMYKKLWKLLIDKDISRTDLCEKANIAASTLSRMKKNEYVSLEVLVKICVALECDFSDIMEITKP